MTEAIANANAAASTLFLGHNGEWWDLCLIVSGIAAAAAATAVAVTAAGSIVSHKREAATAEMAFTQYKLETGKKISEANAAGDAAKADAAKANERAAQAELALERLKTPRTLSLVRQQFVANVTRQFAGQKYRVAISSAADDGISFWESLYASLKDAGWAYIPMPPGQPAVGVPPAGIPIAAAPGVEILFNPANEANMLAPALALGNALHADGTIVAVNRDNMINPSEEPDVILIRIGARVPPPQ